MLAVRLETPTTDDVIQDGSRVGPWLLHLPEELAATAEDAGPPALEQLHLHFRVRRDEERVEVAVRFPDGRVCDLGGRSHHYTLLTLARHRLSDPPGWLEAAELANMLRIDSNLLYTHVHRARRQLAGLDVIGAADVVERRGEVVRLGTDRLDIVLF
jgi:hypothetical protein